MKTRSKCKLVIATLLTLCMAMQVAFAPAAPADVKAAAYEGPDPNFHIYIAFGQSNMDGNATPEEQDFDVPDGLLNMCSDDGHSANTIAGHSLEAQTVGEWYPAEPPLARRNGGLGVSDYFGRKMLEVKQAENPNAKIGIICVAVPGCATRMFDKEDYQAYLDERPAADQWLVDIAKQYGGNPYQRIVDLAKKAKKQGIIKGFIYHQGETDGDAGWASRIKKIYEDLVEDIGFDDSNVPFIAGECVPKMSSQNANIKKLADMGDNFYVASSEGLSDKGDGLHFTPESYRLYGPRYAEIMLEKESKTTFSDPVYEWSADNTTIKASRHCNEIPDYVEEETVNVTKEVVKEATTSAPGTVKYTSADFKHTAFSKQTKTDEIKQLAASTPTTAPTAAPTQIPSADPATTTPAADSTKAAEEKTLSLSSVKCKKNTKKITGKVSESGATVKVKVGKKAVKKATVKGKNFTCKLSYRLKKKTKVVITVTKKDFKTLKKTYTVK